MVNRLLVPQPHDGAEVEALADLRQRIATWQRATPESPALRRELERRLETEGWSSDAQSAVRDAAIVFLALNPIDRDHRAVHLPLDPFDALGPIGTLLD
jgi:hypothetical protein